VNRDQKNEFVKSFHEQVKAAPLVVVARYTGTQVNTATKLRRDLAASGVKLRVVKNSLAKRALQGTGREILAPYLTGMNVLALSGEDPIRSAKAIKEIFAEIKTIEVKAGFFDGDLLDAEGVKSVATLPSREQLLATMLATIQEPVRRIMGVIQAPARDLMFLLKNYENKLSEAEGR